MLVINGYGFESAGVVIEPKYVNLTVSWSKSVEELEAIVRGANGTFTYDGVEYSGYDTLNAIQKNYETATFTIVLHSTKTAEDSLQVITGKTNVTYTDAVEFRTAIQTVSEYIPDESADDYSWMFKEWSGASVAYAVGDKVSYAGLLYKCIQAHTSQPDWTPVAAASLWARTSSPTEEWPEWIQPTGAHDAYQVGDKVAHNGKHWENNTANNVWEPGVYGWDEVA